MVIIRMLLLLTIFPRRAVGGECIWGGMMEGGSDEGRSGGGDDDGHSM